MSKLNLSSEEKCGYLISEEMKKVWDVEIDILEEIIRVCKKNNIKYYINGGTLLGAVRHKGFIPWDDDIDLMMVRKDYEKFLEVAPKELKEPYFCQSYKTEKNYVRGIIQVRNSNTTAIMGVDQNNRYNKGIFVDIFPLDNIPDDEEEAKKFIKQIKLSKSVLNTIDTCSSNFLKNIVKFFFQKIYWKIVNPEKKIQELEKLAQKYNEQKTKYSGMLTFESGIVKYDNNWFKEEVELDFEYLKLNSIKRWDEYLEVQYGEKYMEIPKVIPKSVHLETYFDPKKSYKGYSKEEITKIAKELEKNQI